jgi:small subunit ribosomal protein S14
MLREDQWKNLDIFRRKLFLKNEIKKLILNSIIENTSIPRTYRYFALFNKSKLIRSSSKTQHQNRCVKTGRIWSVTKHARYSRFFFRTESYKGNLPGFRRASW